MLVPKIYANKTYPSKDKILKLLAGFEIISFVETDDKTTDDEVRRGHVLRFIVRK